MNSPFIPSLTHSVNSSGRLGLFVDPYSCPCNGCRGYLASEDEPPGLCNLPPPPIRSLERQTAAPNNSVDGSPVFSPLSHTSSLAPSESAHVILPQRSNGGGIPFPSLGPSSSGLGGFVGFRESRWDHTEDDAPYSGLCHSSSCCEGVENTGTSAELKDEITEHLTEYLTLLEKHQKVMTAKLDLYAFLLEDGSVRLRLDAFNKKIKAVKETLDQLE